LSAPTVGSTPSPFNADVASAQMPRKTALASEEG
jgi:hypothetical protein